MNVSKNPAIAVELQKKWLKELGIDKKTLVDAIIKSPRLVSLSPGRVRDEWLKEFGIDKKALVKVIIKFPSLAGQSPSRVRDEWLKELGIDKEALVKVIIRFPQIVSLSPGRVRDEWLKELGIDKEVLAKAIVKFPPLAGLSPGRVRDEWLKELGIDKEVLAGGIVKYPRLTSISVKKNLVPKFAILKAIGVPPSKILNGLITLTDKNLQLLQLIMIMSGSNVIAIGTVSKLDKTYNRLNSKVKGLTGQSATYWIKQHKDNEVLLEAVVKEISGVGPEVMELHMKLSS